MLDNIIVFSISKGNEYYFLYVNGRFEGCYTLSELTKKMQQLITLLGDKEV